MREFFIMAADNFKQQMNRQKAARAAKLKLIEMSKIVPFVAFTEEERNFNFWSSIGLMALIASGIWSFKTFTRKFIWTAGLSITFTVFITQIIETRVIERVAEYPTDYGQTVRAVLIFKNNEGPKTKHYEELSTNYRKYLSLKKINNAQS
jgi:hypothetical protein